MVCCGWVGLGGRANKVGCMGWGTATGLPCGVSGRVLPRALAGVWKAVHPYHSVWLDCMHRTYVAAALGCIMILQGTVSAPWQALGQGLGVGAYRRCCCCVCLSALCRSSLLVCSLLQGWWYGPQVHAFRCLLFGVCHFLYCRFWALRALRQGYLRTCRYCKRCIARLPEAERRDLDC